MAASISISSGCETEVVVVARVKKLFSLWKIDCIEYSSVVKYSQRMVKMQVHTVIFFSKFTFKNQINLQPIHQCYQQNP